MASNDKDDRRIESPVMTVADVCEFLKIHKTTLYRLLKTSTIPHFRVGSDYRFHRETIYQWTKVGNPRPGAPD